MRLRAFLAAALLCLTAALSPALGAGTLFGLPLSQQVDVNGKPIVGCKLFIYDAGTTTPVTVYEDSDLTQEIANPLETDASGRLPKFWLDDGSYRARFTTSAGVVVFDQQSIVAIGASSGEGGAVGEGGISENSVFQTGDILWQPKSGTRTGWVRANGRTIGSSASGSTERANADTQALYEYLWTTYSDTLCPVTGGRGSSASSDFAANKPIATLDMRSMGAFGLDDMGNSAAGVNGGSTSAAAAVGAATTSITIAQTNLPSVNLSASLGVSVSGSISGSLASNQISSGDRVIRTNSGNVSNFNAASGSGSGNLANSASSSFRNDNLTISNTSVSGTFAGSGTASGNIALGGSGTAITKNILGPMRVGTWYFRL